jgi:hypothetical protein
MIEMSVIAAKKAEQEKGPESIFLYMGLTFGIIIILELFLFFIFSWEVSQSFMVSIMYFLMLGALCIGITSFIREHSLEYSNFKNWFYSFLFISVLIGAILGAYMW